MTFLEAAQELAKGKEVYRPHWKADERLCMEKHKGGKVVAKRARGKPLKLWVAETGDLTEIDWETEIFVSTI